MVCKQMVLHSHEVVSPPLLKPLQSILPPVVGKAHSAMLSAVFRNTYSEKHKINVIMS